MPSIDNSKCILVIGGTSGIGRALALSIHNLPSKPKVIVSGRRAERLSELATKGLETVQFNVDTDKVALKGFVDNVLGKYPDLDGVVFCAGIQHEFEFGKPETLDLDKLYSELNINYTSIVTMIAYFLPHFLKLGSQGRFSFLSPVTSGLCFVPAPWISNYSATKAALHSFTMSLRSQLIDTNVHVMEIIPPLVESELHDTYGTTQALTKFWMPLDEYTKVTMEGLRRGDVEIPAGMALEDLKRYEAGKLERVEKSKEFRSKWL
jgi:short-subunit dehydrogenase involved in D-alanine esterification of teichoic acids